jgi:hypothetical protein
LICSFGYFFTKPAASLLVQQAQQHESKASTELSTASVDNIPACHAEG